MLLPSSSITSAVLSPAASRIAHRPARLPHAVAADAGLEVTVEVVDGSAHVWLRGDVCADTVRHLATVLTTLELDRPCHRSVVLDLAEVTLLSAAGINLIVERRKAWAATGPVLVLANAGGVVARVLDVCRIPLIPAHADGG